MSDITLASEPRTDFGSGPSGRLRRTGKVPAVVYGLGTDSLSISVDARELSHALSGESGANTLITLDVAGESVLTLARQVHRHPTRGEYVHVDFVRISRSIAVSAEIPVHLTGEPVGVRDGGLLEQLMFQLTVEAMPGNIPVSLEHDITGLAITDQLHVRDLALPTGVSTSADPDAVVAQVSARRTAGGGPGEEGEGAEGAAGEAAGAEPAGEGDGE
jgi:large subunit ribosomal protein L25